MSDLIDRQATIDALIRKMRPHDNGDGTITIHVMSEELVRKTLNDLPSVHLERNKGRWYDIGSLSCRCSECGCKSQKESAFCPNCGSDMRGGQDD